MTISRTSLRIQKKIVAVIIIIIIIMFVKFGLSNATSHIDIKVKTSVTSS